MADIQKETKEMIEQTERTQKLLNYPQISTAVTKLGTAIPTINLPAGITCRADAPCQKGCYAKKGNFCFKTVKNGLQMNLEAYQDNPERFFDKILYTLKMVPYKYFRYHSSGDIVDEKYLELMCKVARQVKETKFLCFTKKYELVNDYVESGHRIPKNLIIVFSCWGDFMPDNKHNFPTSYVRFKEGKGNNKFIPKKHNECNGFCGECCSTDNSCWHLKKGQAVVFNQH